MMGVLTILSVIYCWVLVAYGAIFDNAPHEWNITREQWWAIPYYDYNFTEPYDPLHLVVIQHTVTRECNSFLVCASEMQTLQLTYFEEHLTDTPYNFYVGNDGRVYEGRGWGKAPARSRRYGACTLSVGFIGDYRTTWPTEKQLDRTKMLLDDGVRLGHLRPDYLVVGANDLWLSESPGTLLRNAIRKFDHYDHENRYSNMTCEQIKASESSNDWAPHESHIPSEMWNIQAFNGTQLAEKYTPVRMVIIQDSVTKECRNFATCAIALQKLQAWSYMMNEDLPFNFIVANDARVYEGRGWGQQGGIYSQYNLCSLHIGFLGDYDDTLVGYTKVTDEQMKITHMLLKEGVKRGYLHPNYVVVGARDVTSSNRPGSNLYSAIQHFDHYDHTGKSWNMSCDQLYLS